MGEKSIAAASSKWGIAHDFFSSRQSFFFLVLLIAGVVAVYANSLGGPFVWDDEGIIKNSAEIAQKKSAGELLSPDYWQKHAATYRYRPLRAVLFALEYSFWGFNTKGYHAVNILLHLVNVLLLYAAARSLVKDMELSFFVALIFAVHPVHSESVAYVKNATDLLAMMFILLSFLAFKKSLVLECAYGGSAALRVILYLLSLWSFALALLSKEMMVSAPLIIFLSIYLFAQKEMKKRLYLSAAPFFVLAALYIYFLFFVVSEGRGGGEELSKVIILSRMGLFFVTLAYYAKLLFLPTPLNADAAIAVPGSLAERGFLISGAVIGIIAFFACRLLKTSRPLFFAMAWTAITILPVSNLLLISGRLVAEERLYIPAAGYAAFVAMVCLNRLNPGATGQSISAGRWKFLGRLFLVVIALFFSAETIARNNIWRDEIALWANTVSRSPSKVRPHYNLGVAHMKKGDREKAMAQFKIALSFSKTIFLNAEIYNSMAVGFADFGFDDRGIENFKRAIFFKPNDANLRANLGDQLVKKGRLNQGIAELQIALKADPTLVPAYTNLSATYGELGQLDRAIREAKTALFFDRHSGKAYNNIGTAYGAMGYAEKAVLTYKRSLAVTPDLAEPHLGLGAIFLNRLNDPRRAQDHFAAWKRLSSAAAGKGASPLPERRGPK